MTTSACSGNNPKGRWRILGSFALVLFSTFLALLAIEIALRLIQTWQAPVTLDELKARRHQFKGRETSLGHMLMASRDPRLVYELIPRLRVLWDGHEVRTNSSGYRDDEFTPTKPPGTIRIAVLGDSTSFGWRVDKQDAYPEVVEQFLNRFSKGPKFEVMSFALPGYNTAMEREVLLTRALPLLPDVVLLQFDGNDVDLPNFIKKRENHWRLDRCYLWEFLSTRRWRWRKNTQENPATAMAGLEMVPLVEDKRGLFRCTLDESRIPPALRDMVGEENCKRAIRDIGRVCREKGLPTVFVLNPNLVEFYDKERQYAQDPTMVPFVQAARATGFAIADPTMPILGLLKPRGLTSRDLWVEPYASDAHPVPARHTLIALEVARVVLENAMLPAEAIDKSKEKDLLAALLQRANLQWEAMHRDEVPRIGEKAVKILPGDPKREETYLAEGWYGREYEHGGDSFRWCAPQAKLLLPPCKRLVMEIGTEWPPEIGPADCPFLLHGQSLPYRITKSRGRGWFDVTMPETAAQKLDNPLELTIQCKPLDIPGIPKEEKRPLGLRVRWIMIEPP